MRVTGLSMLAMPSPLSRTAPSVESTRPARTPGHQPGRTPSPSSTTPISDGTKVWVTISGAEAAETGVRSRATEYSQKPIRP